jgi:hypothetical protein
MTGIQYLTDAEGHKKAVVIDLEEWSDLWEDIEDIMYVRAHAQEERHPWPDIHKSDNGNVPD